MDVNTLIPIFLALFFKIIPLYILVFLGYLAGRFIGVTKESIALLLIYIIAPVVVFSIIINTPLTPQIALLPLLFWILGSLIALVAYNLGKTFFKASAPPKLKNILAMACGSGNTGYFGLPIVLILFGEEYAGISIFMGFGLSMFENSLGFYLLSKGEEFSGKESLKRILRLPFFYAFTFGILFNLMGLKFSKPMQDFVLNFRGSFTICGMMLIGLGISSIRTIRLQLSFLTISFVMKFMVWPLLGLLFIALDSLILHFFSTTVHHVLILMTIVPLPVNSIAFAIITKSEPETVGIAVLLSTLFALFFIPMVAALF